ncbi:hypothetical protein DM02DRAFT_731433 [Periconia macrospinosa]|uniref:PNPLA domain-containing protein n=1 Tax=Periconia macrospinosa TaxID=97972 RepID=A0A2V1DDE7_9PLEO|nr:hypothetical protein DM02DRAFT_731433 [Periconia macrospinosa]
MEEPIRWCDITVGGVSLSSSAYLLVSLLAVTPSTTIPAYLFVQPYIRRPRWTAEGGWLASAQAEDLGLAVALNGLFPALVDVYQNSIHGLKIQPVPQHAEAQRYWLGEELEALRVRNRLLVSLHDGVLFLGIDEQLRQGSWELLAANDRLLRSTQECLVRLVAEALPHPYADIFWESESFHYQDLIASILLPLLSVGPVTSGLPWVTTMVLTFHLTNLGFTIDYLGLTVPRDRVSSWRSARQYLLILSTLKDVLHSGRQLSESDHWTLTRGCDVEDEMFLLPLLGFTISRLRYVPELHSSYEFCRNWWARVMGDPKNLAIETVARALVFPEHADTTKLCYLLPPRLLAPIGIDLSRCKLLGQSYRLFQSALNGFEKGSFAYGSICAELVKNCNLRERPEEAYRLGIDCLKLIPSDSRRLDHVYLTVATADACIARKDYGHARRLLQELLAVSTLSPYVEGCCTLRLNKILRRMYEPSLNSELERNLRRGMHLAFADQPELQAEFLSELQATVYQARRPEEPLSPDLQKIVADTLRASENSDSNLKELFDPLRELNGCEVVDTSGSPSASHTAMPPGDIGSQATSSPLNNESDISQDPWGKGNLLHLVGGGVRGYWTLLVLNELMGIIGREERSQAELRGVPKNGFMTEEKEETEKLVDKSRHAKGSSAFLPCHYFDVMCGFDTAAWIAIMLCQLRMSMQECLRTFKEICSVTRVLASRGEKPELDFVLRSRDRFAVVDIPPTDRRIAPRPENYTPESGSSTLLLEPWQVARAAVARLPFFKELSIGNIRLGKGLRNRILDGVEEIETIFGSKNVASIVNISLHPHLPTLSTRIQDTFNRMLNLEYQADVEEIRRRGFPFWRFSNDRDSEFIAWDEWKPRKPHSLSGDQTLALIDNDFRRWVAKRENVESLQECAMQLVEKRRARAENSSRWRAFSMGTDWRPHAKETGSHSQHDTTEIGGTKLKAPDLAPEPTAWIPAPSRSKLTNKGKEKEIPVSRGG